MYFANAVYYTIATIGFASFILFVGAILNLLNHKMIEAEIGYRNYFIILGAYVLVALPLAATINGGTGRDYMFWLGCLCGPMAVLNHRLEAQYKASRAQLAVMIAPAPELAATTDHAARPDSGPAPARAAAFDVPAQR